MKPLPHERLSEEDRKHLPPEYWKVIESPRLFPKEAPKRRQVDAGETLLHPSLVVAALIMISLVAATAMSM